MLHFKSEWIQNPLKWFRLNQKSKFGMIPVCTILNLIAIWITIKSLDTEGAFIVVLLCHKMAENFERFIRISTNPTSMYCTWVKFGIVFRMLQFYFPWVYMRKNVDEVFDMCSLRPYHIETRVLVWSATLNPNRTWWVSNHS